MWWSWDLGRRSRLCPRGFLHVCDQVFRSYSYIDRLSLSHLVSFRDYLLYLWPVVSHLRKHNKNPWSRTQWLVHSCDFRALEAEAVGLWPLGLLDYIVRSCLKQTRVDCLWKIDDLFLWNVLELCKINKIYHTNFSSPCLLVLGIEPRALCMVTTCSATEHLPPWAFLSTKSASVKCIHMYETYPVPSSH